MNNTTTALRKISGLKKRIWCIQGSQGAGKTYSILQLLINHALSIENREIFIFGAELSKMKISVIKDFINIMKSLNLFNKKSFVNNSEYKFNNGSIIIFKGLDQEDIGKGLRSHVSFFNECNRISFESYLQISSRSDRVILDYNPDREFWVNKEVIIRNDCDFLKLTFMDNEKLKSGERNEILRFKELGYDENNNIINEYWANRWQVYGLGNTGKQSGAIFQNWEIGKYEEQDVKGNGLDFGSNDPDALVKVSIDKKNKIIYVKELLYKNGLSTDDLINILKDRVGKELIIADSQAKRTIEDIKKKGLNILPVSKNQIVDDIKLIQSYKIIIDEQSQNFVEEISKYIWLDKKSNTPIDKDNHLLDAFRYIVQTLLTIKKEYKAKLL